MDKITLLFAQINIPEGDLDIPRGEVSSATVGTVLELAFGILGSAAFIVMVYAGMKFVLSRGNPDGVAKARNTMVYAAVGLVISILSFAIVRFVVGSI